MTPTFGAVALGGGAAMTAAAAAADPTADLAPYVGGGAGVLAVAALVEVTRRLLKGDLVSRATVDTEEEMTKAVLASGQREDRIMAMAERLARLGEDQQALAKKNADELRDHTNRTARDLAEVTQRQTTQLADALASLARTVQDMRDDLRRFRGGQE